MQTRMKKGFHFQALFNILILLTFTFSMVGTTPVQAAEQTAPGADGQAAPTLLQYSSGGHILGFAPDKVYLAGLDHALTVEFAGGKKVTPVGIAAPTSSSTKQGGVSALGRVTYQNVWQGVDVIYAAAQGGVAESSYIVKPGASVTDIRLKYNTPVQLQKDGTLKFAFKNGDLTESAPIAFQEINGKREPVDVRFTVDNELAGFVVG